MSQNDPRKNVGVLVDNLEYSQLSVNLIRTLNSLSESGYHTAVFRKNFGYTPIVPLFPLFELNEFMDWPGILIATSFDTARIMLHSALMGFQKYFYLFDLEWLNQPDGHYNTLAQTYRHPKVELIARSEYHRSIIQNNWKPPAGIVQDFNQTELTSLLSRTTND